MDIKQRIAEEQKKRPWVAWDLERAVLSSDEEITDEEWLKIVAKSPLQDPRSEDPLSRLYRKVDVIEDNLEVRGWTRIAAILDIQERSAKRIKDKLQKFGAIEKRNGRWYGNILKLLTYRTKQK